MDRLRRAGWLVFFAVLGGAAAWLAMGAPRIGDHGVVARATLDGKPLTLGRDDAVEEASVRIAREWLGQNVTIVLPEGRIEKTREQLGGRVDWEHLQRLMAQLRDAQSPLSRRARARPASQAPLALDLPVLLDGAGAMTALLQLKDDFDRAPVDARYDFKTKELSRDEPGRAIDAWGTMALLEKALWRGDTTVQALVATVPAQRTASGLSGASTDTVMGWFETKYARDQKHEARTFNLRLAASRFDGYVLLPGETFDFNQVVGARSEANGYKVAPVIAQGELVDGIGGGTCQVAGTLHAAAFFAGLELVERKPHTRPSFYIKMGLDAAVAYPTVTLKLGNPYAFPVVLHETVQGGMVRAEVLGPRRGHDVMFARRIDEVVPFAEKEVPDATLPKDVRELKQRGIPGFKVTRWRIVRDGSFAVREHHQDYYPPTTQIWLVDNGPDDPKFEGHDDEHPEYVADEFLSITQGLAHGDSPDDRPGRNGDMVESRIPGRTGTYGWTVREGFAKDIHGTRTHTARNALGKEERGGKRDDKGDDESRDGID